MPDKTTDSSSAAAISTPAAATHPARAALLLGALGVVFGDIGTSPIYALRESLRASGDAAPATVLGTVSLVFWAVVLVVALKYVVLVLRADNRGEGGIIALLSLALPAGREHANLWGDNQAAAGRTWSSFAGRKPA